MALGWITAGVSNDPAACDEHILTRSIANTRHRALRLTRMLMRLTAGDGLSYDLSSSASMNSSTARKSMRWVVGLI
jgi:hypothetical protein